MSNRFDADEAVARRLDEHDPLRTCRDLFEHPPGRGDEGAEPLVYLCGNSLGLMPRGARDSIAAELENWSRLAVEAHFAPGAAWFSYHDLFREVGARLVGALPGEVVMMNSLTVNLHLMMVSFYRPTPDRRKIVIEAGAFPSDHHAVASQLRFHGFDQADDLITLHPREGEETIREDDIESLLDRQGSDIALVLLPGVQYATGQLFDIGRLCDAAHRRGCLFGLDLAHAAGNTPLELHDWDVDFAVWCSYKYLNAGPGATAGCFIHEKHTHPTAPSPPRMEGWWGNDPASRFEMKPDFAPAPGASAWQLSNPSIMAMAPLRASLEIFDRVGMDALRKKSVAITAYLESLIDGLGSDALRVVTPRDAAARGCQLSITVAGGARPLRDALRLRGVVCDAREPDILRLAPTPLYNSFHDVWLAARALSEALSNRLDRT